MIGMASSQMFLSHQHFPLAYTAQLCQQEKSFQRHYNRRCNADYMTNQCHQTSYTIQDNRGTFWRNYAFLPHISLNPPQREDLGLQNASEFWLRWLAHSL